MELEDVSSYVLPPNFILSPSLSGSLRVLVDLLGSIGGDVQGHTPANLHCKGDLIQRCNPPATRGTLG